MTSSSSESFSSVNDRVDDGEDDDDEDAMAILIVILSK